MVSVRMRYEVGIYVTYLLRVKGCSKLNKLIMIPRWVKGGLEISLEYPIVYTVIEE